MSSTVIVALYNGSRFITEQLESIRNQTCSAEEVIIADDGSTDNSAELVSEYIKEYKLNNWKLIRNKENIGWEKNFISNAIQAKGDFVFFCDQDDLWANKKIEVMTHTLIAHKEINLLCGDNNFLCYDGYDQSFDAKDFSRMKNDGSLEKVEYSEENFHIQRPGCSMCIRKTFFDSISKYWVEKWGHDDFCWKYAILSDSCFYIHSYLITRRRHATNTARNEGKKQHRSIGGRINQLNSTEKQYLSLIKYASQHRLDAKKIEFLNHNYKAIEKREKFIKSKNPLVWIDLFINYRDTYPRIKGLYLDFCIVYLGGKICQKF